VLLHFLSPFRQDPDVRNPSRRFLQEDSLSLMRLDQRHLAVRTQDRNWKARKTGTGPDIANPQWTRRQVFTQKQRFPVITLQRVDPGQVQLAVPALKQFVMRLERGITFKHG